MIVGTFIFGLAFGFLGYAWITAPERARARRRMERLQLRADVSVAATAAVRQERDEAVYQYERGVDAIIDRLRAAVDEEETPTHDGLVLDWLAHADDGENWTPADSALVDTLRHLASVYSEHPDYDEGWKP